MSLYISSTSYLVALPRTALLKMSRNSSNSNLVWKYSKIGRNVSLWVSIYLVEGEHSGGSPFCSLYSSIHWVRWSYFDVFLEISCWMWIGSRVIAGNRTLPLDSLSLYGCPLRQQTLDILKSSRESIQWRSQVWSGSSMQSLREGHQQGTFA